MAKVSIRTFQQADHCLPPSDISGVGEARRYFSGEKDPIHFHCYGLRRGDAMRMDSTARDRLAFVWEGEIEAGGRPLSKGSSLIVERGAALDITGRDASSSIVVFSSSPPPGVRGAGGHVHLLPRERVPLVNNEAGSSNVGGLHSNGKCPTCEIWLNENRMTGRATPPSAADAARGIHAHPADEIIFVTEGQIVLGAKRYERGTALAIAADTLYGFSPGPEGLAFVTFRAAQTNKIRFASGGDYIESDFWDRVEPPLYLEPVEA